MHAPDDDGVSFRSELIRDGIHRVARSTQATPPTASSEGPPAWFSREEERLFPLRNMGYTIEQMAREERVTEAVILERLASIERRHQAMSEWAAARYRDEKS